MSSARIFLAIPLLAAACTLGPATQPGFSFLDPGVRSGQEQACAQAVAASRGAPALGVQVKRTSADAYNRGIIAFEADGVSGYCRVTGDFRVLEIVS
jgi:hypothetical protein